MLPAAVDNAAGVDNTWLDRSHGFVEMCLFGAVNWCDRLFDEKGVDMFEQPEAFLRWRNEFRWDELQRFTYRSTVRIAIRLPRLTRKWRLVISAENQGDPTAAIPVDPGNPGTNVQSQVRAISTELVYDLFRTKRTFFLLGAGVQVKIPPDVYARVRFGYVQPLGADTLARFAATAYYHAREGPGQSNQLDFERLLSPATLLRWSNSLTISEGSNGWNWGTELSLGHTLSSSSALAFGGSARGPTRPGVEVQNYRVYTLYRRNILRSWLFCELEPDINWPLQEDGSRMVVWGGAIRLEVLFTGKWTQPK